MNAIQPFTGRCRDEAQSAHKSIAQMHPGDGRVFLRAFTFPGQKRIGEAGFSLLVIMLLFFCARGSQGQVRSATMSGSVRDPAGHVIVGAQVTVTETATNQIYKAESNQAGNFTVPYLPAGNYTVTVADTGFETTSQNNLAIGTGESINLDLALKVGAATEVVQVNTESTGIQVDSSTVQSTISDTVIASIPNLNHNALAYAQLEAGVNTRGAGSSQTNAASFGIGIQGRRQISDFAINGGQAYENDIQLDGLSTESPGFNEVTVVVNTDAVQEVRALVNDYGAQYGRAHGVIQEATKGGTDQFHGLLFLRNRSSILAANFYGNNARGIKKKDSEIYTYGGTFGGPIKKDKAFFFGSYEGLFYNNPQTLLFTIPTGLQRVGDFSQTLVNVNGTPTPLNLYDPFNVAPSGQNLYTRALIPGANTNNSAMGTNQYALNVLKNYPCAPTTSVNGVTLPSCTNRVADDAYGTNNWQSNVTTTFRKANINGRVDYKLRSNDYLYVTGGYTHGDIVNPPLWGANNLWNPNTGAGQERFDRDRNPYISIGNTLSISPTLVLDTRYSIARVDTQDANDLVPSDFNYSSIGISALDQANAPLRVVPSFQVNGNARFTAVNNNNYINKHERQTDHVVAGSISKLAGKWTYRVGGEFRAYLANYTDSQTSFTYTLNSSFTAQTVSSNGSVKGGPLPNNAGDAYASFLLGAGSVGIPAGQTVHPAFLYQYGAIYTQNDWHPNEKLTVNLGARWDWQPGIAERYGRSSSIDLTATNPYGGAGGFYFPKANGNGKRLWDTDWTNFQPRFGISYRARKDTVVRAGAGVTFLPTNSGFFDGAYLFGASSFSPYTNSRPYGSGTPNGVPVGTFDSAAVNQFVPPTGADVNSPSLYGGGSPRFTTRDFKNAYVYQGNLHIQQDLGKNWTADFGYNLEIGKRLSLGSGFYFASDQFIPENIRQSWRQNYISRNGTGDTGSDPVRNPFQPNLNALIPFNGDLGGATMPLDETLQPYPYFGYQPLQMQKGYSSYHALQVAVKKDLNRGLLIGTNFSWSKSLGLDGGIAQNNFSGEGTGNTLPNLTNLRSDKRLSANDTPIRLSSYWVYNLPFGANSAFNPGNRFLRSLVSGYRVSGTYIWQSGVPIQINCGDYSLNGLCDRNPGVPFILPKSFQHRYNGSQSVVLPGSGRTYTPLANVFLKFNPDAFKGRTVALPNGKNALDEYYFGNSSTNYGAIRTDPVNNVTMSLERDVKVRERYTLNLQVNATNLLNHTQFQPQSFSGSVGNIQQTSDQNLGFATGGNIGHGLGTLDPRLVEMQARFSF